jgi:hypothetical protein
MEEAMMFYTASRLKIGYTSWAAFSLEEETVLR